MNIPKKNGKYWSKNVPGLRKALQIVRAYSNVGENNKIIEKIVDNIELETIIVSKHRLKGNKNET